MMLSKNVNNKKCAPKLIFFHEKKIEKDSIKLPFDAEIDEKFLNVIYYIFIVDKSLDQFVKFVTNLNNLDQFGQVQSNLDRFRPIWTSKRILVT